jgi:hypothetical protein
MVIEVHYPVFMANQGGYMVIRDSNFKKIADNVKPDYKKRVVLHSVLIKEGVSYHIYANNIGQIILDPQVTIPASELWLFEDKDILEAVDKSMAESVDGKLIDRGSFAKYTKNEP